MHAGADDGSDGRTLQAALRSGVRLGGDGTGCRTGSMVTPGPAVGRGGVLPTSNADTSRSATGSSAVIVNRTERVTRGMNATVVGTPLPAATPPT